MSAQNNNPASCFAGKKITILGDSITQGVGVSQLDLRYSTVLAKSLDMIECNMGKSGTVICTGGHRTSRLGEADNIPADSDFVCVLLGANDFDQCRNNDTEHYYALGTFGTDDTTTIYGSMGKFCSVLAERFGNTDTKVFMMTPVAMSWNNSVSEVRDWDQDKKNACGYSLRDLGKAILETAEYYGLDALDLHAACAMNPDDFADGIHPNDAGAAKMADTIRRFMIEKYTAR